MNTYDFIEQKINDGMVEGHMHFCIRDVGRLVGGYLAGGTLSHNEFILLGQLVCSKAKTPDRAKKNYIDAVEFGKLEPIKNDDFHPINKRENKALAWDAEVGRDAEYDESLSVINFDALQGQEIQEPGDDWNPASELKKYISTMFNSEEHVAYTMDAYYNEEAKAYLPKSGSWARTAGELIEQLDKRGKINEVFGDWIEECGAWIRINPMDGKYINNDNVADYRYGLVESDVIDIPKQYAIIKELELPVICLVHSGKKSLHAIVRIDASDYAEYKSRMSFLYKVCKQNGLTVDAGNHNPSRLTRMPGVTRDGRKQFLIATNIGHASWDEWKEWIEELNDDLPDFQCFADVLDNPPDLAPVLIQGVLREGDKMMLAGPPKGAKSFNLLELCAAIAEGKEWLGLQCAQGSILYVNLELNEASCIHRLKNVYKALGWEPVNANVIDFWHLRGEAVPMDKLAPKLIRRALKKGYIAVVIDPIYKVITGDENSAEQMAYFFNQFDKICKQLATAVIYCHHHSKGAQGGKRSADRASGSGVFTRDPDALLDMIELHIDKDRRLAMENTAVCDTIKDYLLEHDPDVLCEIDQDSQVVEKRFRGEASRLMGEKYNDILPHIVTARNRVEKMTGWRIEGTIREFEEMKPIDFFFQYPIHKLDLSGHLEAAKIEGEEPTWKDKQEANQVSKEDRDEAKRSAFAFALDAITEDGKAPTIKELAEDLGKTPRTIQRLMKKFGYKQIDGLVVLDEGVNDK